MMIERKIQRHPLTGSTEMLWEIPRSAAKGAAADVVKTKAAPRLRYLCGKTSDGIAVQTPKHEPPTPTNAQAKRTMFI